MQDREVSVIAVLMVAGWTAGTAMVLVDLFTDHYPVGNLGVVVVTAAAVLNVRGYFCDMHRHMRDAFELGRDYERSREKVRSIR